MTKMAVVKSFDLNIFSLEPKGQNGDRWMTFDIFTEKSNMLPSKGLKSRLAKA